MWNDIYKLNFQMKMSLAFILRSGRSIKDFTISKFWLSTAVFIGALSNYVIVEPYYIYVFETSFKIMNFKIL